MESQPELSIVSAFYNEQDVAKAFLDRLRGVLASLPGVTVEILCVNDGSTDGTLDILLQERAADPRVKIIDFSRNFGKEAAMTAGLDAAVGRAVVVIDSDLQDPPELIAGMWEKWREGAEVVLARRADRSSDSPAKRLSAGAFYRFINRLSSHPIPENVGDFRLMDRCVVEAIKTLPERGRFMKGMFAWVGFDTVVLDYAREARAAGSSKFNAWKLWNFALEGITGYSTLPLRVWTYLGCAISGLSLLYALFTIFKTLVVGVDVPGYASLLVVGLFLGGIQLIGLGIIGEYIARIHAEVKRRPIYIVKKRFG